MTHEPIPIHDPPGDEDFIRLPGLFRRWELNDVIELGADFHLEDAGRPPTARSSSPCTGASDAAPERPPTAAAPPTPNKKEQ